MNATSVDNEIRGPLRMARSRNAGRWREDRIECHFSSSRNGMCSMQSVVMTDSSNVTMVHFATDGDLNMGDIIRIS